jgi:hypothetical protein
LDRLTNELSRELPTRKLDVWISPFQEVAYVPAGETAYLTFGINDVPGAVRYYAIDGGFAARSD